MTEALRKLAHDTQNTTKKHIKARYTIEKYQ